MNYVIYDELKKIEEKKIIIENIFSIWLLLGD